MTIIIAHAKSAVDAVKAMGKKFISADDVKPQSLSTEIMASAGDIADLIGQPVVDVLIIDVDSKDAAIRKMVSGNKPQASVLVDNKLEGRLAKEIKF